MVLASAKSCPVWLEPNDGENGYYQVDYKNGLLDKVLAEHGADLSLAERVGVLGNVESLMNSGDLSPQVALALVSRIQPGSEPGNSFGGDGDCGNRKGQCRTR